MRTPIWFVALVSIAVVLPSRAPGETPSPSPSANLYRSLENGSSRDAGTVHGTIDTMDYAAGDMSVRDGRRLLLIAIVPSTAIYRGHQYATLSDLRRGETVQCDVYTINGRLVARSISLK